MTIKEMVKDYLEKNGYDGLVNVDGECGCEIDDLMPCEGGCSDCECGHKVMTKDMTQEERDKLDDDYEWVIKVGKKEA